MRIQATVLSLSAISVPALSMGIEGRSDGADFTIYMNPLSETVNKNYTPPAAIMMPQRGAYGGGVTYQCYRFNFTDLEEKQGWLTGVSGATCELGYKCMLYNSDDCNDATAWTLTPGVSSMSTLLVASSLPGTGTGTSSLPSASVYDDHISGFGCIYTGSSTTTSAIPMTTG